MREISCADARIAVREALAELDRDPPSSEVRRLRDDALLVVSELTANALLHAGGVTHFSARLNGAELELTVGDGSTDVPRRQPVAPGLPGGHGWMVVQRLGSRVDVAVRPDGKTITVALALP